MRFSHIGAITRIPSEQEYAHLSSSYGSFRVEEELFLSSDLFIPPSGSLYLFLGDACSAVSESSIFGNAAIQSVAAKSPCYILTSALALMLAAIPSMGRCRR